MQWGRARRGFDNLDNGEDFEGEGRRSSPHKSAHMYRSSSKGSLQCPSRLNSSRPPPAGRLSQPSFFVCTSTSAAPFTAEEEDKTGGGPRACMACCPLRRVLTNTSAG